MKIASCTSAMIVILATGTSVSNAIERKNASYFCTVEFAGGIAFNEALKKWEGARFRPEKKFVLRLKYITTRTQKDLLGKDETLTDFNVSVTEAGSSSPMPCIKISEASAEVVPIGKYDYVSCNAGVTDYAFNLRTNRFLTSYMFGFINGKENNDDTPAMSGGTCTKID